MTSSRVQIGSVDQDRLRYVINENYVELDECTVEHSYNFCPVLHCYYQSGFFEQWTEDPKDHIHVRDIQHKLTIYSSTFRSNTNQTNHHGETDSAVFHDQMHLRDVFGVPSGSSKRATIHDIFDGTADIAEGIRNEYANETNRKVSNHV